MQLYFNNFQNKSVNKTTIWSDKVKVWTSAIVMIDVLSMIDTFDFFFHFFTHNILMSKNYLPKVTKSEFVYKFVNSTLIKNP